MPKPTVDDVLKYLRGDMTAFREILTNKDRLLELFCDYAARVAKRKKVPAWSVIGDITGNGSGVASAIYELYRKHDETKTTSVNTTEVTNEKGGE